MTTPTPRPATEPARLAAVRATGLLDTGPEESFDRLARLAATLLHAPMAFVTLVDEQRSFWKSAVGVEPTGPRENAREESFCQYVVDRRAPLVVGDAARDPVTRDNPSVTLMGVAAWAGYPLRAPDGEVLGSFCVVDSSPRQWSVRDREVLETLAAAASAEVGMRVAFAGAEERARRLGFLADASALLSSLPDYAGLPARLARFCVPDVAQTAVIHELAEDRLEAVGTADVEQDRQAQLEALPAVPAGGDTRLAQAARRTEPVLARLAPDDQLAAVLGLTGAGPDRWAITAPLRVRGHPVGVLTWVAGPEQTYTRDDVDLVGDFAHRVAQAWDHARLFAQRSEVAATLQRSLLPAQLPAVPGLDLAVRYVAADQAGEVGGDFYDVFPAGEQEWVAVIGDVSGRGVQAAGMTGVARHTLRAVGRDLGPAATLDRLNAALCESAQDERFATVACARLRLTADESQVTVASGGHCRPVLVRADGTVEPVDAPGLLLGLFDEVELSEVELELGVGDALVYYTDGVIEARGQDGLFGEDRLLDVLRGAGDQSAEQTAAGVLAAVEDFRTVGADDDLAVLVLRRVPMVAPSRRADPESAPGDAHALAPAEQGPAPQPPAQRTGSATGRAGAVFSAAAVHRVTGLAEADLAAWPDRYGLVVPQPTSDGAATYTAEQLAALRFLRQRMDAGADEVAAHAELADALQSGAAAPSPAGEEPDSSTCTVLLVDRDPYVLSVLSDAVASRGHRLVTATNLEQALTAADERSLSAAVVEVMLAGQSGLDVSTALSGREVPVLMVSSLRAASDAFRAGAQAFLTKPLDPLALARTVQTLLFPDPCRSGATA